MRIIAVVALSLFATVASACPIPLEATRTAFVTAVFLGADGPFRFLVDTGATLTVVDRAVAARVGLAPNRTVTAVSTTGPVETTEAIVAELRAGNVFTNDVTVLVAALPRFPSHGHLDGILGMNFFDGHSILFDVDRRCVEVDVSAPRGSVLPAHPVIGRVAITIDGLNFVIDSGASFPVLMSAAAQSLAAKESSMEMTSAAGRSRVTSANVPVLRIGRRVWRDVAVALTAARGEREDGLLPVTLFHRVYIDGERTHVIVD